MAETRLALLAADTDRTQDYVFETSRLPEIRGASRLLDNLNHWAANQVRKLGNGNEVIIEGGGSLLAIVSATEEELRNLTKTIETEYLKRTGTATITVDFRFIEEKSLSQGYHVNDQAPFGGLMSWASVWLRRRKDGREKIPWVDTLSFSDRCSSCRIRPANSAYSFPDRPICSVCHAKSEASGKFSWPEELQIREKAWEPHDLSEIGQMCTSRPGNIGFIYLDGDSIGRVFEQIDRWENARSLSEIIQNVTRSAVKEALASYAMIAKIRPSDGRRGTRDEPSASDLDPQGFLPVYPFEILTIGGDDLVLIVPADRSIPMACKISQQFQENMRVELEKSTLPKHLVDKTYTLSGGVVLADDHNPVRTLRNLAGELKSNAKRARQYAKAKEGYLDFVFLMGSDVPDRSLKRSRQLYPYLIEQPGFQPISLIGRPYPVSRLYQAWNKLREARQSSFPTSQISALAEILPKGVHESGLFYKYQRARAGNFEHLDAAINLLQGSAATKVADPWETATGAAKISARTVLWDLAELYNLVPA